MAPMADGTGPGTHLRFTRHPDLRSPVLVAAFEGWNDAGNAATTAVRFLTESWDARQFADIDPEVFYDFSSTRPLVTIDDDGQREISWPANTFAATTEDGGAPRAVTLLGIEPQLRWRTFCEQITDVAQQLDVRLVLTIGALLAEVPHTRPTTVFGTAYDPRVIAELGLQPSRYEGPTGIVGVLHAACRDVGLRSASLWAAVPTYVPSATSPKAALALVDKAAELLHTPLDTTELQIGAAAYERQVSEVVASDDDSASYVERLERDFDTDGPSLGSPTLSDEIEQFLREQE